MKIVFTTTFLLLLILACKKEVFNRTSIVAPANLILEKKDIYSYFKKHPENETIQNSVLLFYQNRNYNYAWFNQDGRTEAVLNFQNQLQNYSYDFQDNSLNSAALAKLINSNNESKTNAKEIENLEIVLTLTYFKYATKAFGGIVKKAHELEWYIPRKKKNYQLMLDALITSKNNDDALQLVNPYYSKLVKKLHLYRDIQKKGGFPLIRSNRNLLSLNDKDSCVIQLKQRLFLSEDLKINDHSIVFTKALHGAVSTFQHRLGIPENGKLNAKTIIELNKTVDYRIKQLLVNLERLRWFPDSMEENYLIVNIPEYQLQVIKNNQLLWKTNVIVGKEAKRTSVFRGTISSIILNPYWNIPISIINEEILPKIKQNSKYLENNNMEVRAGKKAIDASAIDWNTYTKNIPYLIRQKPGKDNALGKIKFLFPNNFDIYLHDTPVKELFNQTHRDFSHGCIRVENPKKLALYLLQKNTLWNEEKINLVLENNQETRIELKPKMPIYIVYFTAWVDENNNLNFRNDIYNLDEQLAKNIFEDN